MIQTKAIRATRTIRHKQPSLSAPQWQNGQNGIKNINLIDNIFFSLVITVNNIFDGRVDGESKGRNPKASFGHLLAHFCGAGGDCPSARVDLTSLAFRRQMSESVGRKLKELESKNQMGWKYKNAQEQDKKTPWKYFHLAPI